MLTQTERACIIFHEDHAFETTAFPAFEIFVKAQIKTDNQQYREP